MQILGAVGPDMGSMAIILQPQSADREKNIPIANLSGTQQDDGSYVYVVDAQRPVEAAGMLLLAIPLDNRVDYDVTIRPIWPAGDDTTRLEINGATFSSYALDEEELDGADWVADFNQELAYNLGWERRPGTYLTGGAIAGIVVSASDRPVALTSVPRVARDRADDATDWQCGWRAPVRRDHRLVVSP